MNDALRCVILERAIAMRRSLDSALDLGGFFRLGPRTYEISQKERDCIGRYRDWALSLGAGAKPPLAAP
jgi:hypothetical protein